MRLSGKHNAGELKEITGAMGSSPDRIDSCMALICAVFVKHVPLCTWVYSTVDAACAMLYVEMSFLLRAAP